MTDHKTDRPKALDDAELDTAQGAASLAGGARRYIGETEKNLGLLANGSRKTVKSDLS